MIEFTLDGTILTANQNFLDAVGYSLDEVKGRHHGLFVEATERAGTGYREFWARLARGEFASGEYRRIAKEVARCGSRRPTIRFGIETASR